ncbi:MAG TPA: carbohydrate porin [Terriglobales bacterium]|nr:carbohydrate porin [Terriglobales bacterium]
MLIGCAAVAGQTNQPASPEAPQNQAEVSRPDTDPTVFAHPAAWRFFIGGQLNMIFQAHPPFHAKYSGPNSFRNDGEHAISRVATLYLGMQATHTTELLFDVEETGGRGLSDAFGLAGFTNLDVVRNPNLGAAPYIARAMIHQIVPLTDKMEEADRSFLSLATSLPEKRLEFRFGKLGMADFFDVNEVGTDSHLQFTNWTIDNNGGYDYAADTRGYTYGAIVEYQAPRWGVRFGEMLMPKVANGIDLDFNVRRARAENLEFELRPSLIRGRKTTIRPLAYLNHANMGSYREAINAFRSGMDSAPDVIAHRHQGTLKQGFGVNLEQELPLSLRLYFRIGWNEGKHESFAYTEVNNTFAAGADISGERWTRRFDRVGIAGVTNGLSRDHREYLALGGLGFLLGDGTLNYGREKILESYYNLHVWRGAYVAALLQYITDPGYNRDRGPVIVPGIRLHADF